MGGAAFFGIVLICGSKLLLVQAVIAILSHWWFLSVVEKCVAVFSARRLLTLTQCAHEATIRQGDSAGRRCDQDAQERCESQHPRLWWAHSQRQGGSRHLWEGARGNSRRCRGLFDSLFVPIPRSRTLTFYPATPKIQSYVDDTKILLKQSGERLVFRSVSSVKES